MLGDIEVHDTAPLMCEDQQHKQHLVGNRRDYEEVEGHEVLPVVFQKRLPRRRWRLFQLSAQRDRNSELTRASNAETAGGILGHLKPIEEGSSYKEKTSHIITGLGFRKGQVFDRMFADATQQLQAEVQLGRPWRFEAVLMGVLLAHEKLSDQVRMRLDAISTENHLPEGNPPK